MSQAHILIKYQDSLICEKIHNRLDFINVPPYSNKPAFTNISVFISLLTNGLLDNNFNSTVSHNYYEWSNIFDLFDPDYLYELKEDTFIYDLDELLKSYFDIEEQLFDMLENMPSNLTIRSIDELHTMYLNSKQEEKDEYFEEEMPYTYYYSIDKEYLSLKLSEWVPFLTTKRTDKDVLLMYSGGKDSTLSAIRLHNAGYNIHFIHFDNGCMKDTDKPYLTYRKYFTPLDGYYFSYLHKAVDIKHLVHAFESKHQITDTLDITLDSEYTCLACRMAMYTETLKLAKKEGYKYIAEGARASQKFLIEQPEFLKHLKELAASYGIKLLLPVIDLKDDQEEIDEIIANGYSSKTWESKCLIGKPSTLTDKNEEKRLTLHYEQNLKPSMQRIIEQ